MQACSVRSCGTAGLARPAKYPGAARSRAPLRSAPVNYLHLVWAAILGVIFFGHMPDSLTVLGMAMVAGAGVAVALRAHYNRQQAQTA
jgi:drug/metabolite transporter (DMT)-like permease